MSNPRPRARPMPWQWQWPTGVVHPLPNHPPPQRPPPPSPPQPPPLPNNPPPQRPPALPTSTTTPLQPSPSPTTPSPPQTLSPLTRGRLPRGDTFAWSQGTKTGTARQVLLYRRNGGWNNINASTKCNVIDIQIPMAMAIFNLFII